MNSLNKRFEIFIFYCIFTFRVSLCNIIVLSLKKITNLIIGEFKFIKLDFLQVSSTRFQLPWLEIINQIVRTKKLTNYPRHKSYSNLLELFGGIINKVPLKSIIQMKEKQKADP